ncbi:MAG TPA: DNA polymerase Y family protein, partial [Caulobacteraceae bacterium]
LWGGEAAMIDDLAARLSRNAIPVRAAIAGSPGAAWALAHFGPDRAIAPPGTEKAWLSPLPPAALRLSGEDAAQIARLGLRSIGALIALPRAAFGRRFGPEVMRRLDQALGGAGEALAYRRPPSPWFARLAFAEPISVPEDLARVTGDIAALLCQRLAAAGRGGRRFELAFHRLDGLAERRVIGLALPGRDASAVARLFFPLLETVDPGFGVEVVTLEAREVEAVGSRQQHFSSPFGGGGPRSCGGGRNPPASGLQPPTPALPVLPPEGGEMMELAPFVDRLVNRLGETVVWRDEAFPSHAPERAARRRRPLAPTASRGWEPERPRPLRLFRRPEPIEVVAPVPDDPPVLFHWRGKARRVRRAEGPERLAQEWWRRPFETADPAAARDYYQVEDETGARFWLFRAGLYDAPEPPKWWLHGLFG